MHSKFKNKYVKNDSTSFSKKLNKQNIKTSQNGNQYFVFLLNKCIEVLKFFFTPFITIILTIFVPPVLAISSFVKSQSQKQITIIAGSFIFLVLIFYLANLQIFGFQNIRTKSTTSFQPYSNITIPKRGKIFIKDYSRNQDNISLTSSNISSNFIIDPLEFNNVINLRKVSVVKISTIISTNLNISFESTLQSLEDLVGSKSRYFILEKFVSDSQAQTAKALIERDPDKLSFKAWLGVEEALQRSYPYDNLLGSTLGYVPLYKTPKNEVVTSDCKNIVEQNERNNAGLAEYSIGYYGLEQKFCSELAGLNGKRVYSSNSLVTADTMSPQNGSDLYLTIDLSIQRKTDEVLEKYIKANTNETGKPENASIIVMESKTGRILSLSSYPNFNPNEYFNYKPESYRNVATSLDYEVGSALKPLTVAIALSENEKGTKDSNGNTIGVSPDFFRRDYGDEGKRYPDGKGFTPSIRNSQGKSYRYDPTCCDLKRTVRDSLNTMISDIVDSIGTRVMSQYFKNSFLFDKPTEVAFAGGGSGNLSTLDTQLNCLFCFAQHGFGQGFYISPIQLMRAFTAVANDGFIVEPYLVEKIVSENGETDNGTNKDSVINRPDPYQIITEKSSNLVTEYMKAVIDEGFLNTNKFKKSIPGYSASAKTGTAQITRPNADGTPCDYNCNTLKGLYDHTVVGFAPSSNPEIMVLVKIAKPNPGVITNFADQSSMPFFKEILQFALEYKKVPKDR